jgi:integrase
VVKVTGNKVVKEYRIPQYRWRNAPMRNKDHPCVSVVPGDKLSYPYHLSFKHPLLKGKQVKRSTKTPDGAQAATLATELSDILRNPNVWRKLPAETSEIVRAIWSGDIIDQTLSASLEETRPRGNYGDFYKPDWIKTKDHKKLAEAAQKILEENKRLYEANATLEAKVDNLTALLKKMGVEAMRDFTPKSLTQACADFLSDDKAKCGTNAGARKKDTWRSWFNRFAQVQSAAARVHEIGAQQVIEHLAAFQAGELKGQNGKPTAGTVKEVAKSLCAMLEHQSCGTFRKAPVKDWVKKHLNGDDGEPREVPYWLEQKDVEVLLKHLPKFWRDVASVQWEGGFRPEELAHIRCEVVSFEKDDVRIDIAPLKADGKLIWKPKTRQSYGKVHLRDDVRETLERLVSRNSFLLFPNDPVIHGGIKPRWTETDEIASRLKLWRVKSWDEQYVSSLRAAAEKAKLDKDRIDGRTLRRSCGKRVLIASNYNLELAAAFLRDHPDTVRKHYARLLPEDVRQPEFKVIPATLK